MAYAIVEFLHHDQVEVVLSSWISDRQCAWPLHLKGDRIVSLVRKAAPPDSCWQLFDVSVKGLLVTLSSDTEVPQKRIRKPPQAWSDDEESDYPRVKVRHVTNAPSVPLDFPQGLSSTVPSTVTESAVQSATQSAVQNSTQSEDDCLELVSLGDHDLSDKDKASSSFSVDEDFKQHVIRLLNILHFTQQQHGDMLNKLCEVLPSQAVITKSLLITEPFTSVDDLLKFNEQLDKEKFALLVRELVQLGGKNANVAAKRMLAYVVSDQVAAKFSWVGRKNKLNFSSLKTSNAIMAAAGEFPQGNMANVEDVIKSWLRHAPERLSGIQRQKKPVLSADPCAGAE